MSGQALQGFLLAQSERLQTPFKLLLGVSDVLKICKKNHQYPAYKNQCPVCVSIRKACEYRLNPKLAIEKAKTWAQKNTDRQKENIKKWRNDNKPRVKQLKENWNKNNPEKVKAMAAAKSKRNPESSARKIAKRRSLKIGNGGELSVGLFDKLFTLQKGTCPACRCQLSNKNPRSPLDHIIPLSGGGSNVDDNIQLLCRSCNSKKHTKHPIDFMQSMGYLL